MGGAWYLNLNKKQLETVKEQQRVDQTVLPFGDQTFRGINETSVFGGRSGMKAVTSGLHLRLPHAECTHRAFALSCWAG